MGFLTAVLLYRFGIAWHHGPQSSASLPSLVVTQFEAGGSIVVATQSIGGSLVVVTQVDLLPGQPSAGVVDNSFLFDGLRPQDLPRMNPPRSLPGLAPPAPIPPHVRTPVDLQK